MFNPDQNRLAPTLAMIMAASLVGFITGYTVPLISLELAQRQIAPLYVGLLAALPPAGMMISSFLSPALCRRVEMGVLLSGSLILLALATIASCMTTDMTLLLLPRLLTGPPPGHYRTRRKLDHRRRGGQPARYPHRSLRLGLYRLPAGRAAADLRRPRPADLSADSDCRGHRRLPADAAPSAHRHS